MREHTVSYYQQADVTDPTPYETDNRILDGETCMICGEEFRAGERIMELRHRCLGHDRFLFHEACMHGIKFRHIEEILDGFGFEVEETEEED